MKQQHPSWIDKHGIDALRISLGIVFIWFGLLKFFSNLSPAEEIAADTLSTMTFNLVPENILLPILAAFECFIGVGLLFRKALQYVIPVFYFQMFGAILPLVIFPDKCWDGFLLPTLLGQYIIKNSILISAAIVLGVIAKGGELIIDSEIAEKAKEQQDRKEKAQ